ncbi:MAG TPA: hypothetical protein VF065_12655 [Ilumatobacter sp.]
MRDDDAERPADVEGDATGDGTVDATLDAEGDFDDEGEGDATVDAEGGCGDDDLGQDDDDLGQTDTTPPVGPRRTSRRGAILGAAMLGFHQAMYGKQETETVIDIEVSGDPPNIDLDGLDEDLDAHRRMVGPPLDQIKSRRQPTRPARPTRAARRTRGTRRRH